MFMNAQEIKQKVEAEIGPYLRHVYGDNRYPNLYSSSCTLSGELQRKCIFKEGILQTKILWQFPDVDDPNYLSPKRKQDHPSRTNVALPSGIPTGTITILQLSTTNSPEFLPAIVNRTATSKPVGRTQEYTPHFCLGNKCPSKRTMTSNCIDFRSEQRKAKTVSLLKCQSRRCFENYGAS